MFARTLKMVSRYLSIYRMDIRFGVRCAQMRRPRRWVSILCGALVPTFRADTLFRI